MKRLIEDQESMYFLEESLDGDLIFTVACGGIYVFNLRIALNLEEVDRFRAEGKPFLDDFAFRVSQNPKAYSARSSERN